MSRFVERKVSGLTIKIDRGSCISSANCINAAPDFFEFDDDRICAFKELTDGVGKEKKIIEACSVCPVNALYVFEENGKQIIP